MLTILHSKLMVLSNSLVLLVSSLFQGIPFPGPGRAPSGGSPPAIAFVQDDATSADPFGSSQSLSFTSDTTSGNMIVLGYYGANDIASCSDNKSNSYTVIGTTEIKTCAAYNITGGASHQVTVTLASSSGVNGFFIIAEYAGIATSAANDQTCNNSDFVANVSCTTGTTTVANSLVVGFGGMSGGSVTPGSGYTGRVSLTNIYLEDKIVSATGTQVVNWTNSERTASVSGVTFKGQ